MNKEAVALATDSAATMRAVKGEKLEKIFTSANKLFALSKYHPVGIMVYGDATFMGVPWETIIKVYREKLGTTKFSSLNKYARNFIEFLDNGNPLFPKSIQDEYTTDYIGFHFSLIKEGILEKIRLATDKKRELSEAEARKIAFGEIEAYYKACEKAKRIPSITKSFSNRFLNKYKRTIINLIKEVFEKLAASKTLRNKLQKIACNLFSKYPIELEKGDHCGVVIAGFGERDAFPELQSFGLDIISLDKLKYRTIGDTKVDFSNRATINAFAQTDMVSTFMEGIDPFYMATQEKYLSELLDKYAGIVVDNIRSYDDARKKKLIAKLKKISTQVLKDHKKRMVEFRGENYVNPVITVVASLPKDELAAMAETLVSLTVFKRKVTMESETVGGPIDVALISKGDGFIWVKRKLYFKPEINPRFFTHYYKKR